jgi:hypothetical protein
VRTALISGFPPRVNQGLLTEGSVIIFPTVCTIKIFKLSLPLSHYAAKTFEMCDGTPKGYYTHILVISRKVE